MDDPLDTVFGVIDNGFGGRVEQTTVGGYVVSTVKLPIDHGFGGSPLWYETMIFPQGSYSEVYCDRYETLAEAKEGHKVAVNYAHTL